MTKWRRLAQSWAHLGKYTLEAPKPYSQAKKTVTTVGHVRYV